MPQISSVVLNQRIYSNFFVFQEDDLSPVKSKRQSVAEEDVKTEDVEMFDDDEDFEATLKQLDDIDKKSKKVRKKYVFLFFIFILAQSAKLCCLALYFDKIAKCTLVRVRQPLRNFFPKSDNILIGSKVIRLKISMVNCVVACCSLTLKSGFCSPQYSVRKRNHIKELKLRILQYIMCEFQKKQDLEPLTVPETPQRSPKKPESAKTSPTESPKPAKGISVNYNAPSLTPFIT